MKKRIGIIDADLLNRANHRFPNLACMKISGYYKEKGHDVKLLLSYEGLEEFDMVFISKVFTDTEVPKEVLSMKNVTYGGTGFFYDQAPPLDDEIEHHFPDYDLYKEWVEGKLEEGEKRKNLTYYLDYSIGYTTRGCFRKCSFCVNQKYDRVYRHSPVKEFLDENRKKIVLLDDNVLGYSGYEEIFKELNDTGKRFQYKQGMDERLLTRKKIELILNSNIEGDYIFAFDDIEDREIIEEKLKIWNELKTNKKSTKFYVLCGYDREGRYDQEFFEKDIRDTFERIRILMKYQCIPYIMRHKDHELSPYKGTYTNLARWCNQPAFYKKKTYREFCIANQSPKSSTECSAVRYMKKLEKDLPDVAEEYFDMRYSKGGKKDGEVESSTSK